MIPELRTPLPKPAITLGRVVNPLHRLFDWLYHSRYNPLYRSGTLAVGFLVILLITGLYLVFFYSVSAPYESVAALQSQYFAGRWIRAVHRYATDGALIATFFHVLQLLVQGKTWGPRTLAWLSGIILLGVLFLSTWTGYVLVWDRHAQLVAMGGAEIFQLFPFLRDTVKAAFNGTNPVTASFFFMNLFLHLALPVGIIFILWVHTAKLSRSRWFPLRPIFIWAVIAITLLGIFVPAVLLSKADLLALRGAAKIDLLSNFWLPIVWCSPLGALAFFTSGILLLAALPWIWRPDKERIRRASVVDQSRCTGCTQCARDCPYEAIAMVPRDDGRRLIAEVYPDSCVSCGICAASCNDICVGPPGRSGKEQLAEMEEFCRKEFTESRPDHVTVITCKHNGKVPEWWESFAATHPGFHLYFADCCGTVHTQVMERLFASCGGIFFHACPERNCFNRDGLDLLTQRIFYKRVPFLAREIDRRRLAVDASSEHEAKKAFSSAEAFRAFLPELVRPEAKPPTPRRIGTAQFVRSVVATSVLLVGLAAANRVDVGSEPEQALLRIGAKLPAQAAEKCRPLSEEDKRTLPLHMQLPQICEKYQIHYTVHIAADGQTVLDKTLAETNVRGDGMFFISEDAKLLPGAHAIEVFIEPSEELVMKPKLSYSAELEVKMGRIYLVEYDRESETLRLRAE